MVTLHALNTKAPAKEAPKAATFISSLLVLQRMETGLSRFKPTRQENGPYRHCQAISRGYSFIKALVSSHAQARLTVTLGEPRAIRHVCCALFELPFEAALAARPTARLRTTFLPSQARSAPAAIERRPARSLCKRTEALILVIGALIRLRPCLAAHLLAHLAALLRYPRPAPRGLRPGSHLHPLPLPRPLRPETLPLRPARPPRYP